MHSVQSPRAPPAAHEASAPHFFAAQALFISSDRGQVIDYSPPRNARAFATSFSYAETSRLVRSRFRNLCVAVVGKVYVVNGIKYDQTGAMVTGMC